MNEEQIFTTEVRIPEEFESLLNVSLKHDKLQTLMKFIFDLLKKHESAVKFIFEKQQQLTPNLESLEKNQFDIRDRFGYLDNTIVNFDNIVKDIQKNLIVRHDTAETLKFLLNLITNHDSTISKQQQEIEKLTKENEETLKKFNEIENQIKDVSTKIDLRKSIKDRSNVYINEIKENTKPRLSKFYSKNFEENENLNLNNGIKKEENPSDKEETKNTQEIDVKKIENHKLTKNIADNFNTIKEQKKNEEYLDQFSLKELKFIKSEKYLEKASKIGKKSGKKEEKPLKNEEKTAKKEENSEKPANHDEKKIISPPKSNFYEAIFPFPNKTYTESEKLSPSAPEAVLDSKNFTRSTMVLPSQLKHLESRVDILEKIVGSSEPASLYHKLEHFEAHLRYFESLLNIIEPRVNKNAAETKKIFKKLHEIDDQLLEKLNSEHFDAVKSLVIALASGVPRNELPDVENMPSKYNNQLEDFEKRLVKLEIFNFEDKNISANIDDLYLKIQRIDQKLGFKVEVTELEKLRLSISQISEHHKHLNAEIDNRERHHSVSGLKPSDSSLIASINRKFLSFEEIMKSFNLPYGVTISGMWEEIQKIWQGIKFILTSLEAYSNTYDSKINEIIEKFSIINFEKMLKKCEYDLKEYLRVMTEGFDKKYADKFEMLRGFKYVENELNKLEKIASKIQGDEAMLARKPLGGWSCGSCEKSLERLVAKNNLYMTWNKLPTRDPKERIIKAGPGFSKMLCTLPLEPIKKKKISMLDDMNLPTIIHSERSVTPQPNS